MTDYRGRFAPSPSGRLHLGSALIAYGSYLMAKAQGGTFLLRLEDLDRPRCPQANTPIMLAEIEQLGLQPDEPVFIQSEHEADYHRAIAHIPQAYRCNCTRALLKQRPCPCAQLHLTPAEHQAIRVDLTRALAAHPSFVDGNFGSVKQADYQAELNPNLVLQRADGIIAYNLAVVVDDHRQGITEVVRGADMLSATFLQLALYDLMGYQAPRFCHLPLVLEQASGAKFSKQNHAPALLDLLSPIEALELCLHLLNAIPHPQSLTLIHERLQRYRQNQQPLAPTEHEPVPAEHEPVPTEHELALAQEEDERLHTLLQQACTRFDPRALPQQALML